MKSRTPSFIVASWGVTAPGGGAEQTTTLTSRWNVGDGFVLSNNKVLVVRKGWVRILVGMEYVNAIGNVWAEGRVYYNAAGLIMRLQAYMELQAGVYGNGNGMIWPVMEDDYFHIKARHSETGVARSVQGSICVEEIITN